MTDQGESEGTRQVLACELLAFADVVEFVEDELARLDQHDGDPPAGGPAAAPPWPASSSTHRASM